MGHIMKRSRRKFLRLAAGAAALPALPHVALALDYPTRPVHWILSAAPGGAADILARLMGACLSERLGAQFIVESHPGAGGNIGTETVVQAAPDGYTLHLTATSDAINATLYENLNFNLVPLHRGSDRLNVVHRRSGRCSGSTSNSMLRAILGFLLMNPARSSVNTIW